MKFSEGEKAFEFDRAKEALAKKGRTGGLVYELCRLFRELDERPTAGETTVQFDHDSKGRPVLRRIPPDPRTTDTLRPCPAVPLFPVGSRVRWYGQGRCGTVTKDHGGAYRNIRWDDGATTVNAHVSKLKAVLEPAPKFRVGDRVQQVVTGGGVGTLVGRVTYMHPDGGHVLVDWPAIRTNLAYRPDELELVRPFIRGERVYITDAHSTEDGAFGTVSQFPISGKVLVRLDYLGSARPARYCSFPLAHVRHAE